jgi:hypothetical protein
VRRGLRFASVFLRVDGQLIIILACNCPTMERDERNFLAAIITLCIVSAAVTIWVHLF